MSGVSMQICLVTYLVSNLHRQTQEKVKCRRWLHNSCMIVSDMHHTEHSLWKAISCGQFHVLWAIKECFHVPRDRYVICMYMAVK